ncbi:hypothetical protein C8J56DRAFT_562161 [Mycena floridula]|nr:hypothetical protein C8J56DRAFT_562161 [Mycena floridula]
MFAVSEFNFVVCGIGATVAATVGYACSKLSTQNYPLSSPVAKDEAASSKSSGDQSEPIPTVQSEESPILHEAIKQTPTPPPEFIKPTSLKRKQMEDDTSDLDYPNNLNLLYPNKRSRTPPPDEDHEPKEIVNDQSETASAEPLHVQIVSDVPSQPSEDKPALVPDLTVPSEVAVPDQSLVTPASEPIDKSISEPVKPASPFSPAKAPAAYSNTFSGGFAGFAGTSSSFGISSARVARPVWASSATSLNDTNALGTTSEDGGTRSLHAITPIAKLKSKLAHITGEEEEDTVCELKGVKLFKKRGNREFSSGMLGHVKVLSSKKDDKKRLVFRREPLWKISMNIAIQPTVLCSFDAEECILRIILKENGDQEGVQDVMVYALKAGKACSKKDFQTFSESLLGITNGASKAE